uniref:MCL1 apoptosis regulator, BCL2 family member n=1 Tax=Anas platyrhynchos platyrhynchos TaxID=8840 RepID=A0A493U0E8_ANAPP
GGWGTESWRNTSWPSKGPARSDHLGSVLWKSEASSQGPARIDHFGSVPWNSEASPRGVVGTAHFGSVLWNSEASPWGWGGTDHFGAVFPEPSSGIFSRPARTNPLGSAPRGRGGDLTILGWFHPTQKRAPEPAGRRDAAPPAAGCCTFKKCKRFRAGPHPFPHHPAGRDFWGFTTPGQIFGVLARKPHSGEQGGVTVEDLGRSLGMLRKLEIKKEEDLQAVGEVAAHLFSDGVTNWGRVVTLISFGAFVARHLKSVKQEKSIGSLARIITDALVSSKREWLVSQGGWEGFVDFFRVEDLEGSIRNVLMAFAGVAGLGASLAYMIR